MNILGRAAAAGLFLLAAGAAGARAQDGQSLYTVNGEAPPIATQQMMYLSGFPPGAYYLEENGDFGRVGEPPFMNANGGPPIGGAAPAAPVQRQPQPQPQPQAQPNPQAQSSQYPDLVAQASRARIFWVYSPSIFSGATGGSSGYIHLCPGGLALRSSEGSISIGGDYDPSYEGGRDSWAGVAGTSASAGRWNIEPGGQGPDLVVYAQDGSSQRVAVSIVQQGSWKFGQTKYAIERNKASCPN